MEEEKAKKKSIGQILAEHPKSVFWTRLVLWATFAGILPFVFVVWRFELFKSINKIQFGGWGVVAIIILAFFIFAIIRYVRLALKGRYSFVGQCLSGICKVIIPLFAFLLILNSVKNNVELLIQVMGCVVICEMIAIPINPLPKWAYEMQKDVRETERKDAMDYFLDGFFKRKKENE